MLGHKANKSVLFCFPAQALASHLITNTQNSVIHHLDFLCATSGAAKHGEQQALTSSPSVFMTMPSVAWSTFMFVSTVLYSEIIIQQQFIREGCPKGELAMTSPSWQQRLFFFFFVPTLVNNFILFLSLVRNKKIWLAIKQSHHAYVLPKNK